MTNTKQELATILDGAPSGATHFDGKVYTGADVLNLVARVGKLEDAVDYYQEQCLNQEREITKYKQREEQRRSLLTITRQG